MVVIEEFHLIRVNVIQQKTKKLKIFICCSNGMEQDVTFVERTKRDGAKDFVFKKGEKIIGLPLTEGRIIVVNVDRKLFFYDVGQFNKNNKNNEACSCMCVELQDQSYIANTRIIWDKLKVCEYDGSLLKQDGSIDCKMYITGKYFFFAKFDVKKYILKTFDGHRLQNVSIVLRLEKRRHSDSILIYITVNRVLNEKIEFLFSTKHFQDVSNTFKTIFKEEYSERLTILDPMKVLPNDYLLNNEINKPDVEIKQIDNHVESIPLVEETHVMAGSSSQVRNDAANNYTIARNDSSKKRRVYKYQYVEFDNTARPIIRDDKPYNRYQEVILPSQEKSNESFYMPLCKEITYTPTEAPVNSKAEKFIVAVFSVNPGKNRNWSISVAFLKFEYEENTLERLCKLEEKCGRSMLSYKQFSTKVDVDVSLRESQHNISDEEECKVSLKELSELDERAWVVVELCFTRNDCKSGNFWCEVLIKLIDKSNSVRLKFALEQEESISTLKTPINISSNDNTQVSSPVSTNRLPIFLKTRLAIENGLNNFNISKDFYWKDLAAEINLSFADVCQIESCKNPGARILMELEQRYPEQCTRDYLIEKMKKIRRNDLAKLISDEIPNRAVMHDEVDAEIVDESSLMHGETLINREPSVDRSVMHDELS